MGMMRRSIYSQDPKHAPPLVEIHWDPKEITAAVKAGQFKIAEVGPMFNKALGEIKDAILKGKEDGTKK